MLQRNEFSTEWCLVLYRLHNDAGEWPNEVLIYGRDSKRKNILDHIISQVLQIFDF